MHRGGTCRIIGLVSTAGTRVCIKGFDVQILTNTDRAPDVNNTWQSSVSECGFYYGRAVNDENIPENIFGPVYVAQIYCTGTFVFNTIESTWLPANNGKWVWRKT